MTGEFIGSKPENEKTDTPRDRLRKFLLKEVAGPVRFEGIEDFVNLDLIIGRLRQRFINRKLSQDNSEKPETKREILLSEDNKKRKEIIRKMKKEKLGENGFEYKVAIFMADILLNDYSYNLPKKDKSLHPDEKRKIASFLLLGDLRNISHFKGKRQKYFSL